MEVTIKETNHVSAFKPATPPAQPPQSNQPPAPPPIPPTPEELQQRASDTAIAMGWEAPKPAEPVAPQPPAAPAAPEPPPKPTVPPPAPPKAPEPLRVSMDDAPARRGLEPAWKPAAPPFELSSEDARDYPVICFMAHRNKEKYGSLPQKFLDFVKAHYDYVAKWETEHPGETYNPDDSEHQSFYAQQPAVDPAELEDARVEMKVEEKIRPIHEERQKASEQDEEVKLFNRYAKVMVHNLSRQVVTMVDEVDPELGKLLRNDKGEYLLTPESEAAVEAADPIAKPILSDIHQNELVPMMAELERLAIPGTRVRLDPKGNAIHEQIAQYHFNAERAIKELPVEEQVFDGRKFVTQAEMASMKNEVMSGAGTQVEKRQKVEELDRTHYTLTIDDLQETIRDALVAKAKRLIAEANARAERKFARKGPASAPGSAPTVQPQPPAPPAPVPSVAQPPAPSAIKPRPPSFSSGADVTPNPSGVSAGSKSFGQEAVSVAFK